MTEFAQDAGELGGRITWVPGASLQGALEGMPPEMLRAFENLLEQPLKGFAFTLASALLSGPQGEQTFDELGRALAEINHRYLIRVRPPTTD